MEATKTEWRLVPVGVLGIVVDLAASLWYLTLGRTPGGDWIRQSTEW